MKQLITIGAIVKVTRANGTNFHARVAGMKSLIDTNDALRVVLDNCGSAQWVRSRDCVVVGHARKERCPF